jgi:copper chaperone CopZ
MERVFTVARIKCAGCAETITKALGAVAGVTGTRVEVADREVRVEYDPAQVDEARVRRALAEAGFPAA